MDKLYASASEAVSDIADGSTVAIAGFGPDHCWPTGLIAALRQRGSKQLTLVSTSVGDPGKLNPQSLIENGQVAKIHASFTSRAGIATKSEELIRTGKLVGEVVPQGILAERCRAGGAGIAAFYSPTGVNTSLASGKDVRYFGGKPYVLEHAIRVDFAFLKAWRADRAGNIEFRGSTHNFNPSFAKAAKIAIVEADEIVEIGSIAPENVHLPGIFVSRVLQARAPNEVAKTPGRNIRRNKNSARSYNGKAGLSREAIARRAARLIKENSYVNLGTGIPLHVCNYIAGKGITLHSENGLLGYGAALQQNVNRYVYSAGSQYVSLESGASFFDSVTSFEMARGGHLDAVVLGAYQVDEEGNFANWSATSPVVPGLGGIGGAMDLVAAGPELIVVMEHLTSKGAPKLLRRCTLPLTASHCVKWVVTDLGLFRWMGDRFRLQELAPGFSVKEVIDLTDMKVDISDEVLTME